MAIIEIDFSGTITVDTDDLAVLSLPSYSEIDAHSMSAEDIVDKLNNGKLYVDFEQLSHYGYRWRLISSIQN